MSRFRWFLTTIHSAILVVKLLNTKEKEAAELIFSVRQNDPYRITRLIRTHELQFYNPYTWYITENVNFPQLNLRYRFYRIDNNQINVKILLAFYANERESREKFTTKSDTYAKTGYFFSK